MEPTSEPFINLLDLDARRIFPTPPDPNLVRAVLDLAEHGVDTSEQTSYYHDTSVLAVFALMAHGKLLPGPHPDALSYEKIYFWNKEVNPPEIFEGGRSVTAPIHDFLHRCGLSFSDYDLDNHVGVIIDGPDEIGFSEALDALETQGISREQALEVRETSISKRGVLLSLSTDLTKDFPADVAPEEGHIFCPAGVPLRYITGIQPFGDFERRLLDPWSWRQITRNAR